MNLQIPLSRPLSHIFETVDVQLRDGSVVENLVVDANGVILGIAVGGQDGVDNSALPFKQDDIQAYRFRAGLGARLGMAQWQRLK